MDSLKRYFIFFVIILIPYHVNANGRHKILSFIQSKISHLDSEKVQTLVKKQYKRLYLMDQNNRFISLLERYSDFLSPEKVSSVELNHNLKIMIDNLCDNQNIDRFIQKLNGSHEHLKHFDSLMNQVNKDAEEQFSEFVTFAYVLNQVTEVQLDNFEVMEKIINYWDQKKIDLRLNIFNIGIPVWYKYRIVKEPILVFIDAMKTKTINQEKMINLLPQNIKFARLVDSFYRNTSNVYVGKILEQNPPCIDDNNNIPAVRFSLEMDRILLNFENARDWVELYESWNLAFVSQFYTAPYLFAKLLIPHVSDEKLNPEKYMHHRVISLYTTLMYDLFVSHANKINDKERAQIVTNWNNKYLTRLLGEVNQEGAEYYIESLSK